MKDDAIFLGGIALAIFICIIGMFLSLIAMLVWVVLWIIAVPYLLISGRNAWNDLLTALDGRMRDLDAI